MVASLQNGFTYLSSLISSTPPGQREDELPEVRRGHVDSHYVDIYPFIWNKMEQSGYVTLYAEDAPALGTFQLRFNGFEQQPTDHYMRPFWQAALESNVRKREIRAS